MEKRLVISFEDGDEVLEGVAKAAAEHDIHYARFTASEGTLRDFDLLSDNYDRPSADDKLFLVDKVSGTVVKTPTGHKVKLHCTLVRKGVSKAALLTGELKKGVVQDSLDLVLTTADMSKIIQ